MSDQYEELKAICKDKLPGFCGVECYSGWFDIIKNALEDIIKVCEELEIPLLERPAILQIKEKFGELRIYTGPYSTKLENRIDDIIDYAEKMSQKTCETCGKPGKQTSGPWIVVSCEECK